MTGTRVSPRPGSQEGSADVGCRHVGGAVGQVGGPAKAEEVSNHHNSNAKIDNRTNKTGFCWLVDTGERPAAGTITTLSTIWLQT